MAKKATLSTATKDAIEILFNQLGVRDQVDILASLYWNLDTAHKDQFLRKTGNE